MPFRLRLTLIFFGVLLLTAAILPLILPIPELATVPVRRLAGPDATFAEVEGVDLHYTESGSAPPTLVLLHGFGPGTFSWRKVTDALAQKARVIAFDRPGFGLSERPDVTGGNNPYTLDAQPRLTLGLLDSLGIDKAVLVASSEGATVAVELALAHPERVAGLVLIGPVLQGRAQPALARALARTPQGARLGPYIMRQFDGGPGLELLRSSYADPDRLSDADMAGYRRPFRAEGWDAALWEVTRASRTFDLSPRLAELSVPTLLVSGTEDSLVPLATTNQMSSQIPEAKFREVAGCGHVPQEECPQKFLAVVAPWLNGLQQRPASD